MQVQDQPMTRSWHDFGRSNVQDKIFFEKSFKKSIISLTNVFKYVRISIENKSIPTNRGYRGQRDDRAYCYISWNL